MKFDVKCHISLGIFFLLQLSHTWGKTPDDSELFEEEVESLIDKVLSQLQEYYRKIKSNTMCIPDHILDNVIKILKKSIDCGSDSERNYASGKINSEQHSKNFLSCFSKAKEEVTKTMTAIPSDENYCTENVTENTHEINLPTAITKTSKISIKNGLEIIRKEIEFTKGDGKKQSSNNDEDGNYRISSLNDSNNDDEDIKHDIEHKSDNNVIDTTEKEYEYYDYRDNENENEDDSYQENNSEEYYTDYFMK